MDRFRSWLASTFALAATALITSACDPPVEINELPARNVQLETRPITRPRLSWYASSNAADYILVARLTIPNVFTEYAHEIRVKRYMRLNVNGVTEPAPEMHSPFVNAHGTDGINRLHYGGGIDVLADEASDENTLALHIHYYWKTPEAGAGDIDETVVLKVDAPADIDLGNGRRLKVHWRPGTP